jgi:transcriptional regulator with XRE-family HTH domain
MLSITRTEFARALGVTHAQVQKYELGVNRIGAGRLEQISRLLQVPISFFFEGPDKPGENQSSPDYVSKFLTTSEGLALAKAFSGIKDPKVRRSVVNLMKAIVDGADWPDS